MASQTVVETIELFFEDAAVRGGSNPLLRRASGSCHVVGVGSWLVRADHGALTIDHERTAQVGAHPTSGRDEICPDVLASGGAAVRVWKHALRIC